MKNRLLKNWTLWRVARAGFALVFIVAGAGTGDYILVAGGVFLLFHALLNTCVTCAGGACNLPDQTSAKS